MAKNDCRSGCHIGDVLPRKLLSSKRRRLTFALNRLANTAHSNTARILAHKRQFVVVAAKMDDEVVEHEPNANVIDFAFHNDDLQGESVVDVCEPQECETGSQNDGSRIAQTYRRYSEEPLPPINEINPCFCICDEYIFSPGFTNGVLSFCSCRVCVGFLCMLPCYATRARRTVMGRGLTMADCFCPCVPLFQTRQKLREARGYTPHVVSDAITATMCCPCACYQTAAEAGVVTDYHGMQFLVSLVCLTRLHSCGLRLFLRLQ